MEMVSRVRARARLRLPARTMRAPRGRFAPPGLGPNRLNQSGGGWSEMLLVKKVSIPIYIGDIPTSSIHKITIPNTLTVFVHANMAQEKIEIMLILIIE